jgi:LysR family cyn operon transcriptional activator
MNLHQLKTFVIIADSGGIHRAAARLNLSQPAASRQIHALEAELGVALFDRIGRRLALTAEGEDLLRRGRRLLAEANEFADRARALKKGETGILRIGATPQVIESTLASFLVEYLPSHPGVEVQLVEDGGAALPIRLDRGDVHLALMAVSDERFRYRPLYPVTALAVVSEQHAFSRRRKLEVANLSGEPLLLLHRSFVSREWIDTACRIAHIRPRILLESGAPHTITALAGAGYGIAIVPSTVKVPPEHVRAVRLTQGGTTLGAWLNLAWDPLRLIAPHTEQFMEELVLSCRRSYPGIEFARHAPPLPAVKGLRK